MNRFVDLFACIGLSGEELCKSPDLLSTLIIINRVCVCVLRFQRKGSHRPGHSRVVLLGCLSQMEHIQIRNLVRGEKKSQSRNVSLDRYFMLFLPPMCFGSLTEGAARSMIAFDTC